VKKVIVVSAIGTQYKKMFDNVAPSFEKYAINNNWEIKVNNEIPGWFIEKYTRKNWDFRLLCCAYRLYQPALYSDYDLLAIIDPDMIINPAAPCLSIYFDQIPHKGFAAVQDVSFSERKIFLNWNKYYYNDFLNTDEVQKIPFPELHVNSGLLLVKPLDIKDEWLEIMNIDSEFNDEQRINYYLTQKGKAFLLPKEWNVIYPYELLRRGHNILHHNKSKIVRKIKKVYFNYFYRRKMIKDILSDAYILHFASTDKRFLTNLDLSKLIPLE
jgi:hypothetical protein